VAGITICFLRFTFVNIVSQMVHTLGFIWLTLMPQILNGSESGSRIGDRHAHVLPAAFADERSLSGHMPSPPGGIPTRLTVRLFEPERFIPVSVTARILKRSPLRKLGDRVAVAPHHRLEGLEPILDEPELGPA